MTLEMWIALGILVFAIILFVTEWIRVDVVALGVVVALMATDLLTTEEALSGFSNPAVLTIAALFVVGGAVLQTGLAGAIGRRVLSIAGTNLPRLILVIMLSVALLSGFMSDTGTVAVLLPAIISIARSEKISASKLLIPLSFGALLGGATTLIGTLPNIIVSDLLRESGFDTFQFFSFTPIGVALLFSGILFMLLAGHRLLPERHSKKELQRMETPEELVSLYRLPDNLFRLRVRRNSSLVGQTLSKVRLRRDFGLTALEIIRSPAPKPVAKIGGSQIILQSEKESILSPDAEQELREHDILVVKGEADDVAHSAAALNLGVQPASVDDKNMLISEEVGLAEILLPPRSSLLGKTLVELNFGSLYKLTVLGIHRPSTRENLDIGNTPLRFGDTLLVQGPWKHILELRDQRRDFVVMGQPDEMISAPARERTTFALLILLGMLLLLVLDIFPVATASMLAALLMILTGCLTIDDAYKTIDWKSIVLVAGMLPMSIALEKVGLVDIVASELAFRLGNAGPRGILLILFLVTSLLTQVLSNTATTVLIAPVAIAAAQNLSIEPQVLMMGVAIAASMAFASPIASPVNTLVLGAGNYRFSDFIKVGGPMIFLTLVVVVFLLPFIFPF